jgi:hypothetical protein
MNRNDIVSELPPGRGPKQPPAPAPAIAPMVYVHERPQWEYKIMTRGSDELLTEEELNALGKDGWELSGVTPSPTHVQFYFKRAK